MESETCMPSTSTGIAANRTFDHILPSTSFTQNEKNDDDNGEFYFESEHLALKGNKDYLNLLKTISVLEAQRIKAVEVSQNLIFSSHI